MYIFFKHRQRHKILLHREDLSIEHCVTGSRKTMRFMDVASKQYQPRLCFSYGKKGIYIAKFNYKPSDCGLYIRQIRLNLQIERLIRREGFVELVRRWFVLVGGILYPLSQGGLWSIVYSSVINFVLAETRIDFLANWNGCWHPHSGTD